jgi:hypothetical protein
MNASRSIQRPTMRPMSPHGSLSEPLLSAIVADLAAELDRPPTSIDVVRVEPVVWRDGALGCPEPGVFYTQALIEGFRVILAADGGRFDYRVGRRGDFRRCDHPVDEGIAGSQGWTSATE